MSDKKKPTDDLLEGFDDAFDDELDQAFGQTEAAIKDNFDKTEFVEKEDVEKTEFQEKPVSSNDEKTQVHLPDEDGNPPVFSTEPTHGAHKLKVPTEDLSSLFQDSSLAQEGVTEDPSAFEDSGTSPRAATEDLAGLFPDSIGNKEGKTEIFEPQQTDTLSSMIDSDLLEPAGGTEEEPPLELDQRSKPNTGPATSDLSGLFDEKGSVPEGRTEDISSLIDSEVIDIDESSEGTTQKSKFPEPPSISAPSQNQTKREASKAAQNDMEPMASEVSENTITVHRHKKKMMLVAGVLVGAIAIGGGVFVFLKKKKTTTTPEATTAATDAASATPQEAPPPAKQQPEVVIESAELLKELDQKYAQTAQFFSTDRYQSYTEATNALEDILRTFPNHKKANARLAEAILLKFDGYLDNDRKNRVYQLIQKAEETEPGSIETLRARARMLMVEGKYKDASVRINQALGLDANNSSALITQGEIFYNNKDYKNAMNSFAKASASDPASVRAKYFLNLSKEQLGNLKGASAGFAPLTEDMNAHPKSVIETYAIAMKEKSPKAKADLEQYLNEKEKSLSPSESARGWLVIAEQLLKQGARQGAIDALEKSVSKMALDHKTTFELGNLYFEQKDYQKASQHYSTSVTLDPENVPYLIQLGICLREQSRPKEAEEQLKKATMKDPKNYNALYQYSYTRYKLGFAEDVMKDLAKNVEQNPDFVQGKILLGTIQVEKNNFANALKNFNSALSGAKTKETRIMALMAMGNYYLKQELWAKAKPYYLQASQLNAGDYDTYFALAKINIQLNQINEAQEYLRQMQKINPASVEAKVLQAGILSEKQEYDKAIEVYRDVLKAKESNYETRILLAKTLMDINQYKEALQELLQAYKYNADYYYTYYYMGLANRGLGDMAESERNLTKAITLMPKFYKAHYELGKTYFSKDDIVKGTEAMKKALEIEPSFIDAITAMGDYYNEHGVPGKAEEYYKEALKISPNRIDVVQKLAKNYHEMGKDKQSIKLFEKIIQLKPNSAAAYYELGVLYEENNNSAQALRMYQRNIALTPKDPKPYYQLGFLYKALGQRNKAIQAFRTFINLNPDAAEKADIEDQINKLATGKI